jgi:VanZ family protein
LKYFIPALMWAAAVFALSTFKAVSPPRVPAWLEPDKVAHAAAYFVLASLIIGGLRLSQTLRLSRAMAAIGVSILFGVAMEIIQFAFFPGRMFEIRDIVANIIGSFASLFIYYFIK